MSAPSNPTPDVAETPGEPADRLTLEAVKRKLLHGSAWVLGGRIVTVVLGLVMNKLIAHLLPLAQVGAYFQTLVLVFVGSVVGQLGLDRAVVRFVSTAIAVKKPGQAKSTVKTVFVWAAVGSAIAGLVLGLGFGRWYALSIAHNPILASLMPITAGWLIVTALRALLVDTFRGFQKFSLSTIFDQLLVDVLTVSLFGAMYVLRYQTDVHQIVLLSAAISTIALLVGGGLLLGRMRGLGEEGEPVPRGEIYAMAWPLLITNLSIYLLGTGVDQFVLGAFRPAQQVALYGAAARVMFLVATPYLILQGVTPPLIAEMWAKGKKREMERTLRMVSTVAGLPAAVALVVFVFFGGSVMSFFFKPSYAPAAGVLAILSTGRLIAVWTGSAGVTLMMTGYQKRLMLVTVFSGAASVAVGLLLAPHFGKTGVAIGTAGTQAMQNTLQLWLVHRKLGIWTCAHLSPKPLIEFLRKKPAGVSK